MKTSAGAIAISLLTLVVAACSSPSTVISTTASPTLSATAPAQPTAPAAQPTAAPAQPTAAPAQPTAAPAQPSATQAQPAATQAQPAPAATSNALVKLVVDSAASQARYHAHEQLVGKTLPSEAVGTSTSVSGSLVLGADGSIASDQSKITVDLSRLQSDESRRDNWIKNNTIQTSRFPMAIFVPREAQGLPYPLPTSGEAAFQLLGDLTVHGVTKPVTWQVTAQFGQSTISGSATTSVNLTDFGMTPPRVGPVLNIEDGLTLELAFTAAREA